MHSANPKPLFIIVKKRSLGTFEQFSAIGEAREYSKGGSNYFVRDRSSFGCLGLASLIKPDGQLYQQDCVMRFSSVSDKPELVIFVVIACNIMERGC